MRHPSRRRPYWAGLDAEADGLFRALGHPEWCEVALSARSARASSTARLEICASCYDAARVSSRAASA